MFQTVSYSFSGLVSHAYLPIYLPTYLSAYNVMSHIYLSVYIHSLLLSAVSGEDVQARTDRVVLIPWVKFLWESYRQCLDLLRNNNRLEGLYQDVAHGGNFFHRFLWMV